MSVLRSRAGVPLIALLLLLALTGCSATVDAAASPAIDGAHEVEVVTTDFAFQPTGLTIDAGTPLNVVLINEGATQHDLYSAELEFRVMAAPGEQSTGGMVVDEPGVHELVCSVPGHAERGMRLTLSVQ